MDLKTECDLCDENHSTESCPQLQEGEKSQEKDSGDLSRARMTLPSEFWLVVYKDGRTKVITRATIPAKKKFGPLEAPRTTNEIFTHFPLKIFSPDSSLAINVDISDENECNWLSLIRVTDQPAERNCLALQIGSDIYFVTSRTLEPGTEMVVGYAPHYERKMLSYESAASIAQTGNETEILHPVKKEEEESVVFLNMVEDEKEEEEEDGNERDSEAEEEETFAEGIVSKSPQKPIGTHQLDLQRSVPPHLKRSRNIKPTLSKRSAKMDPDLYVWRRPKVDPCAEKEPLAADEPTCEMSVDDAGRPTSYGCGRCPAIFTSLEELVEHKEKLAIDSDRGDFQCPASCGAAFNLRHLLFTHQRICCPETLTEEITACSKCNRAFPSVIELQVHSRCHGMDNACAVCDEVFEDVEVRESHTCKIHPKYVTEKMTVVCWVCTLEWVSEAEMKEHLQTHRFKRPCVLCGRDFPSFADLHKHLSEECDTVKVGMVQCPICFAFFDNSEEFKNHYSKHVGLVCGVCRKVFEREEQFLAHYCCGLKVKDNDFAKESSTKNKKRNRCDKCGSSFLMPLSDHICAQRESGVTETGEIVTYVVCPICGKRYSMQKNLNQHVVKHHLEAKKDISCKICFKTFTMPTTLASHMEAMHSTEPHYECGECGLQFFSRYTMLAHYRKFHMDRRCLYECDQCDAKFTYKWSLQKHILSHSKKPLCECTRKGCNARFRFPEQLKRHEQLHVHGRRLRCDDCDKCFVVQADLERHKQAFHSGKVYRCKFCHSKCHFPLSLRRHIENTHPEKTDLDMAQILDECYVDDDDEVANSGKVASSKPMMKKRRRAVTIDGATVLASVDMDLSGFEVSEEVSDMEAPATARTPKERMNSIRKRKKPKILDI